MKKAENTSNEPGWKKWTTIIGSVVAVFSFALNFFLGVRNHELNREKQQLETSIKISQVSADLETRYFVVTGLAMFNLRNVDIADPAAMPSILQNQVFTEFQEWLEAWGTAGEEIVLTEGGVQRGHGMTLLHITNRGGGDALQVVLTVRQKDFSTQGDVADNLWEIDSSEWKEKTIRLADLRVGKKITIPLAHTLGTNEYFGRVLVPVQLSWYNPILQKQKSIPIQSMAPEEQWINEGLNIRVAQ